MATKKLTKRESVTSMGETKTKRETFAEARKLFADCPETESGFNERLRTIAETGKRSVPYVASQLDRYIDRLTGDVNNRSCSSVESLHERHTDTVVEFDKADSTAFTVYHCHETTVEPETIQWDSSDWTPEHVAMAIAHAERFPDRFSEDDITRLRRIWSALSEHNLESDDILIDQPEPKSFAVGDNRPYRLPIRIEPVNPNAMPHGDCDDPIQWDRNVRGSAKRNTDDWPADVYCGPIKVANLRGPMPA